MSDLRIENIQKVPLGKDSSVKQKTSAGFGAAIKKAIERIDGLDKEANKSVIDLLQEKTSINETMIALQKADISMRLFLAIRNKVVDAYKEIMHMQF